MDNILKTALCVAPNGARRTKQDHSALPMTSAELAVCAAECAEAGAAAIHIHVRDGAGRHVLDADAYGEAIAAIRQSVGDKLVIQTTSEANGEYTPQQQMDVIRDVRPEAASLAIKELAPDLESEGAFACFLEWMRKEEVRPQFILYGPEDALRLSLLCRKGLIPWDDPPVLFVLGRYSEGQVAHPAELISVLHAGSRFMKWSVCAFGRSEARCAMAGILLGGHARIGFENNFFLPSGEIAQSNGELIAQMASQVKNMYVDLMDACELRSHWT